MSDKNGFEQFADRIGSFEPSPDTVKNVIESCLELLLEDSKWDGDYSMNSEAVPINLEGYSQAEREALRQKVYRIGERISKEYPYEGEEVAGYSNPAYRLKTKFRDHELLVWWMIDESNWEEIEEVIKRAVDSE